MNTKIFGIGLGRTGTTSLTRALEILGYKAIHYPRNMQDIRDHDAALDETVACRFVTLDSRFPGSKFIYTFRDVKAWLSSYERVFSRPQKPAVTQEDILNRQLIELTYIRIYGQPLFDRKVWEKAYRAHDFGVRRYFENRPRDILFMNITAGDGWRPLCQFLNKPIPAEEFPHLNKSS